MIHVEHGRPCWQRVAARGTDTIATVPRVAVSVLIRAPLADVWHALADLESHTAWMADARAIAFPGGRRSGPGTVMEVDTRIGPFRLEDRLEVTEWEEPRRIAVEHLGPVGGTGRFDLAPLAGAIRFTWTEHLRFPWWLGGVVTALLARPVLTIVWRRNLGRFKAMMERGLSDP